MADTVEGTVINTIENKNEELLSRIIEIWPEIITNVSRLEYRNLLTDLRLECCSSSILVLTHTKKMEKKILLNWQNLSFEIKSLLEIKVKKTTFPVFITSNKFQEILSSNKQADSKS